jgi:hypothetical protein
MGRAPSGRVKVAGVKTLDIHHLRQGPDHALLHELAQPGQVHGDQVVAAAGAGGVAQAFLAQPVDRKDTLVDVASHDLFELPLEGVHHHEGGVAVAEQAQPARQLQRLWQRAWRRDGGLTRLVGATEEIVLRRVVLNARAETHAGLAVDPRGQLAETVQQVRAWVQREAAAGFRARALFDQPRRLDFRQFARACRIWHTRGRHHRRRGDDTSGAMAVQEVQDHVEMRVWRVRIDRGVDLDAEILKEMHHALQVGIVCGPGRRFRAVLRLSRLDMSGSILLHLTRSVGCCGRFA